MKSFILLVLSLFLLNLNSIGQVRDAQVSENAGFSLDSDNLGAIANSINLFTGEVALPMNLVSLPSRGGLSANITISYSTVGVRQQVKTRNLESPTGILGLGWSLGLPRIIVDTKETGAIEDDEYFIVEGGITNRLIRAEGTSSEREYVTSNYQFWKIVYKIANHRWEITKEDGTLFVYGDDASNRNTVQYGVRWGNWIGNSKIVGGQVQQPIIWNLSEIKNTWGDAITFEYEISENLVGHANGKNQTEASYLKRITTPTGSKVELLYANKLANEIEEPHTEQAEPDAYQERYENKFLNRIEIWNDSGLKERTIRFGYGMIGSSNLSKRLLTDVIPESAQGESLPGIAFEYLTSGTSMGCLNKVTNSWGGAANFTYSSGLMIGNSHRTVGSAAPTGYAEPNVWQDQDYVVVSWRQLNNGNHDEGGRPVKLYAYRWEGEWKEQFLETIANVSHEVPGSNINDHHYMDDFQLRTSRDFFAVLHRNSANSYELYLYHKNELERGTWHSSSYTLNVDPGHSLEDHEKPVLLVGENFVAVHTLRDADIFTYTWDGDSWRNETLTDLPENRWDVGSGNNWLVSHYRSGTDQIYLRVLDEQKKWSKKEVPSTFEFNADFDEPSSWVGANGYLVCVAGTAQIFIYRWNEDYSTFYRNTITGTHNISDPVIPVNNSLVGLTRGGPYGALAVRFDGNTWHSTPSLFAYYLSIKDIYFSFSEDLVSWAAPSGNDGYRKQFDPNVGSWGSNSTLTGLSGSLHETQMMGTSSYYSKKFYHRTPNNLFVQLGSISDPIIGSWVPTAIASGPNFFAFSRGLNNGTGEDAYLIPMKNGNILPELTIADADLRAVGSSGFKPYRQLTGFNTLVLGAGSLGGDWENLTSLMLVRFVNEAISGQQTFYPVVKLELSTEQSSQFTSFEYNTNKASVSPNGLTAQFSMVKTIPGSSSSASTPHGWIESYFFNGLPSNEAYQPFPTSDPSASTHYMKLTGASYGSKTFNNNGVEIASNEVVYKVFNKTISNGTDDVAIAYYSRPISTSQIADNINTSTSSTYDVNTGLVKTSTSSDWAGGTESVETNFKYWWQQYDTDRSEHILSGVIQTQTLVNGQIAAVQATNWKQWNTSNTWAPWQTYIWKGPGSGDFIGWFGSVGTDWVKVYHVYQRDDYGNVLEVSDKAGVKSSFVLGYNHTVPVAEIVNADYNTVKSALGGDTGINNLQSQDGQTLRNTLAVLRTHTNLSNALASASTIDLLDGLTSTTDPNGLTIFNEYTELGQLATIKDDDGNIIEHTDYFYQIEESVPELKASTYIIDAPSTSGNDVVTITSNGDWTANDNTSWLTVTPSSGNSNGTISIGYSQNGTDPRSGTVTINGQGLTEVITVNQEETSSYLSASTSILSFDASTTSASFNITSNVSWTINTSYYDGSGWVSKSPSSGTGDRTINVTVGNPGQGVWEADLNITGGGLSETVHIVYFNGF